MRRTQKAFSSLSIFVVWLWAGNVQPQESLPPAVAVFASELESRVVKSLDIGAKLRRSSEDVIAIMRNHDRMAKAWQLAPELVTELTDGEVMDFVSARANQVLVCGSDLMSLIAIETADEESLARLARSVTTPYYAAPRSGEIGVSRDCATITDASGEPIKITTRAQFESFVRVSETFNASIARELITRNFWNEGTYRENMEYLAGQYGDTLTRAPRFVRAARLGEGTRVFTLRLVNLTVYIGLTDGQPRLLFAIPFTS